MAYDDGEARQQFSICLTTQMRAGKLRTSSETSEVEFVTVERIAILTTSNRGAEGCARRQTRPDRIVHRHRSERGQQPTRMRLDHGAHPVKPPPARHPAKPPAHLIQPLHDMRLIHALGQPGIVTFN